MVLRNDELVRQSSLFNTLISDCYIEKNRYTLSLDGAERRRGLVFHTSKALVSHITPQIVAHLIFNNHFSEKCDCNHNFAPKFFSFCLCILTWPIKRYWSYEFNPSSLLEKLDEKRNKCKRMRNVFFFTKMLKNNCFNCSKFVETSSAPVSIRLLWVAYCYW